MAQQDDDTARIAEAAELLTDARRILAVTGAGLSADSGLPTYRGVGGLYEQDQGTDGLSVERALSGEVFARNPELTWQYLVELGRASAGKQPNAGHHALRALEAGGRQVCVVTQNVDGLHHAAGSRWVLEIHGRMQALTCTACDYCHEAVDYQALNLPPRCPQCGHVLRPPVVLFGEMLPEAVLAEFREALYQGFDVMLSVGTSSLFPYITEPFRIAAAAGIPTIEINPEPTPISTLIDIRLALPAARALGTLHRNGAWG